MWIIVVGLLVIILIVALMWWFTFYTWPKIAMGPMNIDRFLPFNEIDLVISRYSHSLDWLKDVKFKPTRIYIYNKGNTLLEDLEEYKKMHPQATFVITELPNVGMCDHTYAHHIVHNYDDLSELVIFTTDTCTSPNKIRIWERLLDRVGNSEAIFPLVIPSTGNYTKSTYTPKNQRDKIKGKMYLEKARVRPLKEWYKAMTGEEYKSTLSNYGGIFAVSKRFIHHREKDIYKRCLTELSLHTHGETAHYMERTWYRLFMGPIPYKHTIGIISVVENVGGELNSWLDYYRKNGVSKFYIVDTGSTDKTVEILQQQSDVEYYQDTCGHAKIDYYNTMFQWARFECEWILTVDIDEYVGHKSKRTILDYLSGCNHNLIIKNKISTKGSKSKDNLYVRTFVRSETTFRLNTNRHMTNEIAQKSNLYIDYHIPDES